MEKALAVLTGVALVLGAAGVASALEASAETDEALRTSSTLTQEWCLPSDDTWVVCKHDGPSSAHFCLEVNVPEHVHGSTCVT